MTGANQGIGFETAKSLAQKGASVHLVCRNRERGEAARDAIVAETNGQVQLHVADLSSVAETKKLAAELLAAGQPLHLLVNNAGCLVNPRRVPRAATRRAGACRGQKVPTEVACGTASLFAA